jgi:hypothetical protein
MQYMAQCLLPPSERNVSIVAYKMEIIGKI